MAKTSISRVLLLLGLLMIVSASGCSGGAPPAPAPPPAPQGRHDLDMKPMVREYFANAPEDWNLISSQQVLATKPFIVDVRQPEEYGKGFIEGSINIPLGELARSLSALPGMDKEIALVCSTGHRSTVGMMVLQFLGYKNAKSLTGGMTEWQAAKLPVVTSPTSKRLSSPAPKIDPDLQATLDFYLNETQQVDWGRIGPAALTEDRKLKSSAEQEIQPETFDQGPSLLVDVDSAEAYAQANLTKAMNIPLRELPGSLDTLPLDKLVLWA